MFRAVASPIHGHGEGLGRRHEIARPPRRLSVQRLTRLAPDGFYAATDPEGVDRILYSDPFEEPVGRWRYGRRVDLDTAVERFKGVLLETARQIAERIPADRPA